MITTVAITAHAKPTNRIYGKLLKIIPVGVANVLLLRNAAISAPSVTFLAAPDVAVAVSVAATPFYVIFRFAVCPCASVSVVVYVAPTGRLINAKD